MEEAKITEMVRAATDEVFRTMLGMEAEPGESYTDLGPLGLSIPTVIYGRNYRALSGGNRERLVVPFQIEGHRMEVKICLVQGSESYEAGARFAGAIHTH